MALFFSETLLRISGNVILDLPLIYSKQSHAEVHYII